MNFDSHSFARFAEAFASVARPQSYPNEPIIIHLPAVLVIWSPRSTPLKLHRLDGAAMYETLGRGSRQDASSRKNNTVNAWCHEYLSSIPKSEHEMPQYYGWTDGRSSTTTNVSPKPSLLSLENSPVLKSSKSQPDQRSEMYKQPTKHPPKIGKSPRVLTPIEPATPASTSSSVSNLSLENTPHKFSEMTTPNMAAITTFSLPPPPPPPPPRLGMELQSSNDAKVRSTFVLEKEYIDKQRAKTFSLRSAVQQVRTLLRQKGDIKAAKDDKLFQRVRRQENEASSPSSSKDSISVPLLDLIDDSQKARDEYGPLEDECAQLENRLYSEESRLYKLEELFYSNWTVVPGGNLEISSSVAMPQAKSPSAESQQEDFDPLCHFSTTQYHPLTEKFLSLLGDLDLLREQFDDVMEEKEHLEEQIESRKLVKLSLGPDEQAWLESFPGVRNLLHEKIQAAELEVNELRKECLMRKLVDKYDNPTESQGQGQELQISDEEDEPDTGAQLSVYVRFPRLSEQHGIERKENSDNEPKQAQESDLPMIRINEWLLGNLRSSPLEIVLLVNIFEMKGRKLDERWQLHVLRLWYEDSTIRTSARIRASSMDAQAPFQSDHSDTVGNFKN